MMVFTKLLKAKPDISQPVKRVRLALAGSDFQGMPKRGFSSAWHGVSTACLVFQDQLSKIFS
jgi:hypothetical protein